MADKYHLGDQEISPLPFGTGRQNDEKAKNTSVVLNRDIEGGASGETVKVSDDRATWLIANGYATTPENYVDQYADSRRPATPPEEDPEPDPEEGEPEV